MENLILFACAINRNLYRLGSLQRAKGFGSKLSKKFEINLKIKLN